MAATLYVVGLGPGDAALLTPQSHDILHDCPVIVGYTRYVELVPEHLLAGKTVISTGMMGEMKRCEAALEEAKAGKDTAIVCSGDPGIYAMAGLVYELVEEQADVAADVDVQIIPGVSALSAAAALLGAPLMHDFACISLSDLLTPWDMIEKRLACAAEGDFVIVLYNPKSKKRDWQLPRALEIIRQHRNDATPAGIVRQAYRNDQQCIHTTVADLSPADVDMLSTIIIGNSSTRMVRNSIVTPRGYMNKYR